MKELLWKVFAFVVSREPIANYLIRRARLTPYRTLEGYMERDWLFNPYSGDKYDQVKKGRPSIRIHRILRADLDQHLHDHPWRTARTIILKGWYNEHRLIKNAPDWLIEPVKGFHRKKGNTAKIDFGEFHQIVAVSPDVTTLFITWEFKGMWGFLVNGKKIPYKQYLAGERDA